MAATQWRLVQPGDSAARVSNLSRAYRVNLTVLALVALFTYMTENPDLCTALYGKSWESEFTRNAKKLIAERCLGEFAPDGGTEEQKYMLAFAVNGCFGTIVAWQEAGFKSSANTAAIMISTKPSAPSA